MNYHNLSHSKFLLKYHFVIVVKYRKRLLVKTIKESINKIVMDVCRNNNYIVDAIESDFNHLHLLLDLKPTISPKEAISKIKQITTFRIYKEFRQYLKSQFWKENTFWTDGYFVCSTGAANTETIRKYIENQG